MTSDTEARPASWHGRRQFVLMRACLHCVAVTLAAGCERGAGSDAVRAVPPFADPFGTTPTSLSVKNGTRLDIVYRDSSMLTQPMAKQYGHARVIAGSAWKQIGSRHAVDTVGITFTDKPARGRYRRREESTYFFYKKQMETTDSKR